MHILIIPSWYPASAKDVGGSFFREQAQALQRAGHKVGVISPQVISLRSGLSVFKALGLQQENDDGVSTVRFRVPNLTPGWSAGLHRLWLRLGIMLFRHYVKQYGWPDIIHVQGMAKAAFVAHAIWRQYRIPYVITEHSSVFARDLVSSKLLRALQQPVQDASRKLAVSHGFADLLQSRFSGSHWHTLPNMVSPAFLDTPLSQHGNEPAEQVPHRFITVSLLNENKQADMLVTAFAHLHREHPQTELIIGGDGPCKTLLQEQVHSLGLQEAVRFTGLLNREEVLEEMRRCDTFVLSSAFETFGVVLIEALALGKPVVATRCGGPESIVTADVGYLVDKKSYVGLYQGMKQCLQGPPFYPEAIRAYCRLHFSEAAVVQQLEALYGKVLAEQVQSEQAGV